MSLFHRLLLALYPRDFRAEYGDEWLELARRRSVRELLADTATRGRRGAGDRCGRVA